MSTYKTVQINKGKGGWGGPLVVTPNEKRKYVISVTGGGVHPVAEKIAELCGGIAVDSFKNPVDKDETLCAVIDCGGTARCGTYPRLRIPTVNIKLQEPSGPLAKFMTADIFVSGTTVNDIEVLGEASVVSQVSEKEIEPKNVIDETEIKDMPVIQKEEKTGLVNSILKIIDKLGRLAGSFINIMYQAGRETIQTVMTNILPFMAFVATVMGIINYTGIGNIIATGLTPLAGSLIGLIFLGFITGLPFLSPLLAPGAVMAAIIGLLIGQEIAAGTIPAYFALPALFAINGQVGCDFAPVGLTLGEAKAKTISVGVPAILFSRIITAPLAVILAYFLALTL